MLVGTVGKVAFIWRALASVQTDTQAVADWTFPLVLLVCSFIKGCTKLNRTRAEVAACIFVCCGVCDVQTENSCGRRARCWSRRRRQLRRAVGESGWSHGGGDPDGAGRRNPSHWQPAWTRLQKEGSGGEADSGATIRLKPVSMHVDLSIS